MSKELGEVDISQFQEIAKGSSVTLNAEQVYQMLGEYNEDEVTPEEMVSSYIDKYHLHDLS